MNYRSCNTCLFGNVCDTQNRLGCSHFYPVDDETADGAVEDFIERERHKFRDEWWQYISNSEE